jgi:hypothetical protein
MVCVSGIIDLIEWRRARDLAAVASAPAAEGGGPDPAVVARLDRAAERLFDLVSKALEVDGRLQPRVETELLALMGELTVGLVSQAAGRAERLVKDLSAAR